MGQEMSVTDPVLSFGDYGIVRDESLICKMPLGLDEGNVMNDGVFIRPINNRYRCISMNPTGTSLFERKMMNVFALPPVPRSWKTLIERDSSIPIGTSVDIPVGLYLMDMKVFRESKQYIVDTVPFGKAMYIYTKRGPAPTSTDGPTSMEIDIPATSKDATKDSSSEGKEKESH